MLGDQFIRSGGGLFQRGQSGLVSDVAQGDTDVAKETTAFRPEDGRVREANGESRFVKGEELDEIRCREVGSRVRFHEFAFARESVPGTDLEAIVAAINAIPEQWTQVQRDGALEFDREVGDATAGIELEGRRDGGRRARTDTAAAGAAAVSFRRVGGELEGGQNLPEKNPVPELAVDEVGMFADETQARAFSQVAFEQRAGIDVPERPGALSSQPIHEFSELFQPLAENVMIIVIAGVAGDDPARPG